MRMSDELTMIVSQFGPAGLMGLLWVLERRHAALRDRQLSEAHRRLALHEHDVAALLGVVRDNTRAIVTLEQTQRQLQRTVERVNQRLAAGHGRPNPRDQAAAAHASAA